MFQGNKKGRPRAETHITRWTEEKALLVVGIRFCVVDHDPSFIVFEIYAKERKRERERDADLSTSLLSFISLPVILSGCA